jgi:hypothetical protein
MAEWRDFLAGVPDRTDGVCARRRRTLRYRNLMARQVAWVTCEVRAAEGGISECGQREIRVSEVRPTQIRIVEVYPLQEGAPDVRDDARVIFLNGFHFPGAFF